MSLTTANPCRP